MSISMETRNLLLACAKGILKRKISCAVLHDDTSDFVSPDVFNGVGTAIRTAHYYKLNVITKYTNEQNKKRS